MLPKNLSKPVKNPEILINIIRSLESSQKSREDVLSEIWKKRNRSFQFYLLVKPYIVEPKTIYKLDVKHFLSAASIPYVGSSIRVGLVAGIGNEIQQTGEIAKMVVSLGFVGKKGMAASAFHEEDLFSNHCGTLFRQCLDSHSEDVPVSKVLEKFLHLTIRPIQIANHVGYQLKEHSSVAQLTKQLAYVFSPIHIAKDNLF